MGHFVHEKRRKPNACTVTIVRFLNLITSFLFEPITELPILYFSTMYKQQMIIEPHWVWFIEITSSINLISGFGPYDVVIPILVNVCRLFLISLCVFLCLFRLNSIMLSNHPIRFVFCSWECLDESSFTCARTNTNAFRCLQDAFRLARERKNIHRNYVVTEDGIFFFFSLLSRTCAHHTFSFWMGF